MAEAQPPTVVEGATTGDVEDEIPQAAKSAEDRKAAAALSSLDAPREDESLSTKNVDQDAVKKAMDRLAGPSTTASEGKKKETEKREVKKAVKVDPADVALVVEELELSKPKATELLKANEGDVVKALRSYVRAFGLPRNF